MRRGFSNDIILNVLNSGGSELVYGELKLALPSGITALESDKEWFSYSEDTVTWIIEDLGINEREEIILRDTLDLSIQTGDQVSLTLEFETNEAECSVANNDITNIETIVGAIDPNEKYVHPMNNDFGYTFAGQDLSYKILFQNEGSYYATNVIIEDVIDDGLDISTLREVVSSHDFTMEIEGRKVTFRFNNIMLPTKDEDEEGSQGFIQFKITPHEDVTEEYEVHNTAGIVFDFEDPIITNTVKSKMTFNVRGNDNKESGNAGETNDFNLYPLPISTEFVVEMNDSTDNISTVVIVDINGKEVFSVSDVAAPIFEFNNTINLSGMYILEVTSESGEKMVQKIIFE